MTNHNEKLVEVIDFDPLKLHEVFCNGHLSQKDILIEKFRHLHFFIDYFNEEKDGHAAKTIVIEHKYLSKSYLQDYSNYYSTSYVNYTRFCKRIHFFAESFSEKKFEQLILNPTSVDSTIWNSYLGYIVIRPLPKAIFGATLLKHFEEHGTGRHYTATRNYNINLLGRDLKLNSLVFQEQDSVVGACASSALWSAMHKISMPEVFQTPLLSPSDLTKSVKFPFNEFSGRIFPNDALTLEQVLESIHSVGLVSELFTSERIKQLDVFKGIVYGYAKMGLPVLLMMKFEDGEHHLVTITGYRFSDSIYESKEENDIKRVSDKITKLYAHDDQVGPFSRLEFIPPASPTNDFMIKTAWVEYGDLSAEELLKIVRDNKHEFNLKPASPEALIIPLSDLIRIPYNAVHDNLLDVNIALSEFIKQNEDITWDIYLEQSNNYKNEIFKSEVASQRLREKILPRSLPKYIWIAKVYAKDILVFEVVFDATNVKYANFWKYVNIYDENLRLQLRNAINNPEAGTKDFILDTLGAKYLEIIEKEVD